jgi:hypothetical protein
MSDGTKGDPWLWKFRFKRERGIEPTAEQIEVKKQELISKLPKPDEIKKRIFRAIERPSPDSIN